jgi:coenzyme F420-reducing hydrogenase delta subunit
VKGFEFQNVLERYSGSLAQLKANSKEPAILVFVCQWSEFSALDNPDVALKGKNAMILEVPCFKAMDPVHVVNALKCGFDGVMGVVCSSEDCKLEKGRDTAERNLGVLKDALKKMKLGERFGLYELSPRCEGDFKQKLDDFHKKIQGLPHQEVIVVEAKGRRTRL